MTKIQEFCKHKLNEVTFNYRCNMKAEKSSHEQNQTNAEHWVEVARKFGEKCVAVQQDAKLSLDQKLEKQKSLSKEMIKEIQKDSHLKDEEKATMIKSIDSYINDWSKMHDILQNVPQEQKHPEKHKK
jgi:hypothetical protein